ncbi:type II toxin-antitoxin system VapC family toxin [Mitsuaria sp. CC2]|uniref:PIN domain-containing protein n=1 Tax=Mitsuaria sp. CC2 TaxID=3029186 RepID=UPI003B8B8823
MKGVDTNILVRFMTQDTPHEYQAALTLLESFTPESPGYISIPTVVELVWVLDKGRKLKRDEVARNLLTLLRETRLVFQSTAFVLDAVTRFHRGRADFADYLIEHLCRAAGCDQTMTFDRDAASCAGMTLLPTLRTQNPIDFPAPRSVSTPSTAKMIAAMP